MNENSLLTEAEERSLGLAGHDAVVGEATAPPSAVTAEGASIKEVAVLTFMTLGAALPQKLGLTVSRATQEPSILRVVANVGQLVEPTVPAGQEQAVRRDPEDSTTLLIDLGSVGIARIGTAEGRVLVLKLLPDGGVGLQEYVEHASPWALAAIPPPEPWWRNEGDSWIQRAADDQLVRGSSIGNAIAVGLFARLLETPPGRAKGLLADIRAGRPHRAYVAPRAWAQALNAAQLSSLEELALTHTDRWHSRLEGLATTRAFEEPSWQEEMLAVCHGRDDLECVHFVLAEGGAGQRLGEAARTMDRDGDELVRLWPNGLVLDDPRLERVAAWDPSAWWAHVVQST